MNWKKKTWEEIEIGRKEKMSEMMLSNTGKRVEWSIEK